MVRKSYKKRLNGDQDMLGEQVGSLTASTINKPLSADGALPKFEVTATGGGTLAGAEVQTLATYSAEMRADGTLYGECPNQGVIMTQDGVATFRATGSGSFTADGGAIFRGAVYFQASAPSLASLNGTCCVYHWDVDAEGNATWDIWEWK
jgi:hypothetical protein